MKHHKTLCFSTALASLLFAASVDAQQIYKWKDERGITHYSESVPPNTTAQIMDFTSTIDATPGTPAAQQPADRAVSGCQTYRCQFERMRDDRLKNEAAERAERESNLKKAAARTSSRGMSFDVYSRLEAGMSEGELLQRAGAPDYVSSDTGWRGAALNKTWFYNPTPSDPFATRVMLQAGRILEIERIKQFW